MGCYVKEQGEFTLPTAVVSQAKKVFREAANAHREAILKECVRFWVEYAKRTRSQKKYREALAKWSEDYYNARERSYGSFLGHRAAMTGEDVHQEASWILEALAGTPRQVQQKDLPAKKTTKDTQFEMGHDGYVALDGRKLIYCTDYNKRSDEYCRASPVGQAFFTFMKSVTWTRGTGGCLTYTDEYMRDDMAPGADSNRIQNWYGPIGKKEFEWVHGYDPVTCKVIRRRYR